ncbi:hypothetical protein R1A27_17080 [Methylobacterium sp. NMS12]|uniref:hypothetical protein n=1 Tax=Methylobacterium sp. NMS12 TaxID=3079766 RepID=UPI003F885072
MPVLAEENEVVPRLEQLGLSKAILLEVIRAAVGARRNATPFHPITTAGFNAWSEGTAHLRRILVSRGWRMGDKDNIASVYNAETDTKIIFQNAERAGDVLNDPIANSRKGAGAARAVERAQYDLFPETQIKEIEEARTKLWCLFVMAEGDDVRAELSRPIAINEEQYDEFHERIVLVQHGEWQGLDLSDDNEPPLDFDVTVSRKN